MLSYIFYFAPVCALIIVMNVLKDDDIEVIDLIAIGFISIIPIVREFCVLMSILHLFDIDLNKKVFYRNRDDN